MLELRDLVPRPAELLQHLLGVLPVLGTRVSVGGTPSNSAGLATSGKVRRAPSTSTSTTMSLATTCGSRLASAAVCTTIHGVVSFVSCCVHSARVRRPKISSSTTTHSAACASTRRAGGEARVVEQVATVDHLAEIREMPFGLDPPEVELPTIAGRVDGDERVRCLGVAEPRDGVDVVEQAADDAR